MGDDLDEYDEEGDALVVVVVDDDDTCLGLSLLFPSVSFLFISPLDGALTSRSRDVELEFELELELELERELELEELARLLMLRLRDSLLAASSVLSLESGPGETWAEYSLLDLFASAFDSLSGTTTCFALSSPACFSASLSEKDLDSARLASFLADG
jgi:hypothetical protein